jgi:hypothetical protein
MTRTRKAFGSWLKLPAIGVDVVPGMNEKSREVAVELALVV